MSNNLIFVSESPIYQAQSESIAYAFEWSAIGTPATAGTVTLTEKSSGASLGTANLSGTATLDGTKVNTPAVQGLTAHCHYLLENHVTISGQVQALQCEIIATP